MDKSSVEIRNPRCLKIIMGFFSALWFCGGIVCWLSLFVPVFEGRPPTWFEAFGLGTACFAYAGFFWWPTAKSGVRADVDGIVYHTGFKHKMVRWNEVASYYDEGNEQPHGRLRLVFLNAQNEVLLQIPGSRNDALAQSSASLGELRQFVAAQLIGKKADAPFVSYEPEVMAARSLEVDWKSKTLLWKIARMVGLVAYAAFWCGVGMALLFAVSSYYPGKPQSGMGMFLTLLSMLTMIYGPALPYIVWLKVKKRKIAREWEARDKIES